MRAPDVRQSLGEETHIRSVSRDPSKMLDDRCGLHTDCIAQFYAAVEPMRSAALLVGFMISACGV